MTNQYDRELWLLSNRLNVVRDLLRERAVSSWALDYWRTVEGQLERKWDLLIKNIEVRSPQSPKEQEWMS